MAKWCKFLSASKATTHTITFLILRVRLRGKKCSYRGGKKPQPNQPPKKPLVLITPLPWGWHGVALGQRSPYSTAGWGRLWDIRLGTPGWKAHTSICVRSSFGEGGEVSFRKILFWYKTTSKTKENFANITKSPYSLSGCSSVRWASVIIAKARRGSQSPEREDFSRLPLACWATWDKALHPPTPRLSISICKEGETPSPPLPVDLLNTSKMEGEEKRYHSNWAQAHWNYCLFQLHFQTAISGWLSSSITLPVQ